MKNIYSVSKIIFLLAVTLSAVEVSFSQQTGSFTRTVTYNANSRTLCYYVPANYNASNKYKLIVGLHGLGDTPQNFRDYLMVNSQMANTSATDAIVVCYAPAGGANGDFWTPVSDTGMVTKAINDAISAYNIDQSYIILTGFSLGGRSALRYGLYNYSRFHGMELWTPAIQAMSEANNQTSFKYKWENGKYIPICITVGGDDNQYNARISTAYQHLVDSGAIVNLKIIYGMGHDAPPDSLQFICFPELNAGNASYGINDAGVSAIATPFDEECNSTFTPVVTIQNKGQNNLTSAVLNYQIDNSTVNTYNWSGNLQRLGVSTITLPSQSVSAGAHTFNAYTALPNGTSDILSSNDGQIKNFNYLTIGASMPMSEGFESSSYPQAGWKLTGTDKAWNWTRKNKTSSGGYGQSASCIYFDNFIPDNTGKNYSLHTPQYDFSNATSPTLSYDYAYTPVLYQSTIYGDTLAVYYSTDCGNTWTSLLNKGGMALSTTGSSSTTLFVPTAAQWKTEIINLPASLIGQPEVMFSFENRCQWGNMMYLDNINITAVTAITEETSPEQLNVFPNPFSSSASVVSEMKNCSLKIFNVTGNVVRDFSNVNQFPFAIERENLSSGIYFLELRSESKTARMKLIVE